MANLDPVQSNVAYSLHFFIFPTRANHQFLPISETHIDLRLLSAVEVVA